VPATLSEYPRVVREIKELFLAGGISADSRGKTEQYRQRADAVALQAQYESQDAYLASLEIKVELSCNAAASVVRISELTMKSNQFNLTTLRYSESEVITLMQSPDGVVYSLFVSDKFGKAGLTGVVFMRYLDGVAQIENFLMSCRVIGRGVETAIWSKIASEASQNGCTALRASFIPTAKNAQVADFYDRLGLELLKTSSDGTKHYGSTLDTFTPPQTHWIELTYVE
jgi:FkbH-like protein